MKLVLKQFENLAVINVLKSGFSTPVYFVQSRVCILNSFFKQNNLKKPLFKLFDVNSQVSGSPNLLLRGCRIELEAGSSFSDGLNLFFHVYS